MIVIGLLLLVAAVAFGIDLVSKNNVHIANPTVFGERLGVHSAASLFVVGAITGAAVLLGVALLFLGMRRKGARALNRHQERAETRHRREDRTTGRPEDEKVHPADAEQSHRAPDQEHTDRAPAATTAAPEHVADGAPASSGSSWRSKFPGWHKTDDAPQADASDQAQV
jgi:hypothetical protein